MFRDSAEIGAIWATMALANAILTQVLKPTNQAGAEKTIRKLLIHLGANDSQVTASLPHVWDAIQEVSSVFIAGDSNAFVVAENASHDMRSDEAMRLGQHAHRLYNVVLLILPELKSIRPARVMVPMIAGMLLHLRNNAASRELRKRMDEEGDVPLLELAEQGIAIRRVVLERFLRRTSSEMDPALPATLPSFPLGTTQIDIAP